MTTQQDAQIDLTRPIDGIENRTAQEVFDIMADRINRKFAALSTASVPPQAVDHIRDVTKFHNHREWLEQIVATGSQRSGFAGDTLRALDVAAEDKYGLLGDIIDICGMHGVMIEDEPVRIIGGQIGAYQQIISLLVEADVLDGDADVTGDQVLGLLRMFLPV